VLIPDIAASYQQHRDPPLRKKTRKDGAATFHQE